MGKKKEFDKFIKENEKEIEKEIFGIESQGKVLQTLKEKIKESNKKKREDGIALGVNFRDGLTYNDLDEEQSIYEKDQKRINKKYNSKKFPNFRLTAEYLIRKYLDREYILDKNDIIRDLKISMGTLNIYLSELNRFEKFQPMRWISVKKKKDFIEVAGIDFKNSTDWIKKNFKGLISRTTRILQTKEKIKIAEENKALQERKKKVIIKEKRNAKN